MSPFRHLFDFERPETPGELLFFKLFEGFLAVFSVQLAWQWGLYLPRIERVVAPQGLGHYVDLSPLLLPGVGAGLAVLVTLAVGLGFLRLSRWAYLGTALLLHLLFAARFSLGALSHSANLFGMTVFGLGLAMLAFRTPFARRRFTLGFTYFYVGLAYTGASLSKLTGTGLHWSQGQHLWLWIEEKSVDVLAKTGASDLNVLQELLLSSLPLATAFLTLGWLSEFFAFLSWWRPLRTPVLLVLLGLHMGIYLTMNILFTLSILEVGLLALPWGAWLDVLLRRPGAPPLLTRLQQFSVRYA